MTKVKTPLLRQMEARECGAVALGIILAYYGKYLSLSELRRTCGVTREGVKVSGIVHSARQYGLKAQALKREHLHGLKLPVVIYWNFNHFLVVEEVREEGIHVNDPAYGYTFLSNKLVDRYFSGIVLIFEPTEAFIPSGNLPNFLPPRFLQPYVVIEIGRSLLDIAFVTLLLSGVVHWGIFMAALIYITLRIWGAAYMQSLYSMEGLFKHTISLPYEFFSRYYVNDIASRQIMVSRLGSEHIQTLQPVISLLRVTIYSIGLMLLSPLFLTALVLGIINVLCIYYASELEQRFKGAFYMLHARLHQLTYNAIHNIESIKLQGGETLFQQQLRERQAETYSEPFHYWLLFPKFLNFINLVILMILTVALVETGKVSLHNAIIGFCLSLFVVNQALIAGQSLHNLRDFKYELDRISDFQSVQPEKDKQFSTDKEIVLTKVTFGYGDETVVEDIDLKLLPGIRVGLVGRSGSGKSTLVSLIAGLYRPQKGKISTNRQRIAFADGQSLLLDTTIADNLRLFDDTISMNQIRRAVQDAALENVISVLPDQYQTAVSSIRHPFSKGQLQCLEIARILARNPDIILLDEATSALDAITEAAILQNIAHRQCTTLIVSHRLSAIRDCDEIIVMEKGRIVERGTHQTLLESGNIYPILITAGEIK